jgi:uncharacterized membrane protein
LELLPIPTFIFKPVFDWMRTYEKLAHIILQTRGKAHLQGQKLRNTKTRILVAIPLPGTGAWTIALGNRAEIPPRGHCHFWGVVVADVLSPLRLLEYQFRALNLSKCERIGAPYNYERIF